MYYLASEPYHWIIAHAISFIFVYPYTRIPSKNKCQFFLRKKQAEHHTTAQIFRYGGSIFCLPHRPIFSDIFDLCLHWVSIVRGLTKGVQNHWGLKSHKLRHIAQNFQKPIQQLKVLKNFQVGLFQTVVWSRKVLTFLQLILVKVLDLWLCNSYLFP